MNYRSFAFIVSALYMVSCGGTKTHPVSGPEKPADTTSREMIIKGPERDTLLVAPHFPDSVMVHVLAPKSPAKGAILLLHGWNLPHMEWCEKTDFCNTAAVQGYYVIVPNFGKSAYQYEFYRETVEKYRPWPTRQWMLDSLFPYIQQQTGLLQPGQRSFVLGLSTGGRGALLLALDAPQLFRACASLSGDFDQREMPADNIMTNYYGPLQRFPERWAGKDNIAARAAELKVPVFLSHTRDDKVVPFAQTEMFYDSLQTYNPELDKVFIPVDTTGHTYTFWGSRTDQVLEFFGNY